MVIKEKKIDNTINSSNSPQSGEPGVENHHHVRLSFSQLATQVQGEVHTDAVQRRLLATDASIFQKIPTAVVYPKSAADVQAVVRFAAAHKLSVHARGAGSGLCGSSLGDGIIVDFSKYMNQLLHLDTENRYFECEPGYRFGELAAYLDQQQIPLFFPPDPSSGEFASFGGMYATNASGSHSVKYGNVGDYLLDADVVFGDANATLERLSIIEAAALFELPQNLQTLVRIYQDHAETIENAYPQIACNVAGYNLRGLVHNGRLRLHKLLAGAEGTLAVVTRLKFRLIDRPASDSLVVAYCDDIVKATEAVQRILPLGPSGIEIMDKSLLHLARQNDAALDTSIPQGVDNVLLIEFDGDESTHLAQQVQRQLEQQALARQTHLAVSEAEKEKLWHLRKAAVPILYRLKSHKKALGIVEDAAVPVDQLVAYFEGIYTIFERFGLDFILFGHIAKGLIHARPLLDLKDPNDIALMQPLLDAVYELVDRLGGTISGEHGDGRLRSVFIQRQYPEIHGLFKKAKDLLDPHQLFNPEIKLAAVPDLITRHLRYGSSYQAGDLPNKQLLWHEPLALEAEKCHGCAKCTTITTATRMCPIYKFTRSQAAAPKAKANLLRALISGAVKRQELFAETFQHVMALCVNCGSCFSECPSNVNIPKLALEAKAQYAKQFSVTLSHRLTAHVEDIARATHKFSFLTAPMLKLRSVKHLLEQLTGIAAERNMVTFAHRSLFERIPVQNGAGDQTVLFFAGCYAGYIRPDLGQAAVRVLNHLGIRVLLPRQHCCGFPLLSKGIVTAARRKAKQNLKQWGRLLETVDYLVVTCSSCGLALMQEWTYLIDAQAAHQVQNKIIHICELINRYQPSIKSHTPLQIAYHQPCHLRVQPESTSSLDMLSAIKGVTVFDLQSHCCGMAGSWGMSTDHYDLSRNIGAPMIQRLNASTAQWALTDCPTCQMQIEQFNPIPVRHPVEVVWAAVQEQQVIK